MALQLRVASILPLFATVGLIVTTAADAFAADVSPWDDDLRSAARLIAASSRHQGAGRVFRGGVHIKLRPGWKTYWRYPGDSGVPPTFDFAASENVKSVTVLYPAPLRFDDGSGGTAIGYKGEVVLPLHVVPQDTNKPVTLRLKLDYAACEKLCVPAKAALALMLTGEAGAQDTVVGAAEARVPRTAAIGDAGTPAVRAVRRESAGGKPRIIVDVAAPAGGEVTLFAEGPTPDWALPVPEPSGGAEAGLQRFAFALDGLPKGATPEGALLRLTAVAAERAVEVAFRLD
jgi:DsbC/DsbD-like thiol-disulfide interchange protein